MSPTLSGGAGVKFSVALCTYNGARHLADQLASVETQIRQPDEIVVSDDGSTDDTLKIVEEFARRVTFPVRLVRQPTNLGVTQNFGAALAACQGEYIALCDQDDVWLPAKLEAAEKYLDQEPRCLALFSDATLVDEALNPLIEPSLWGRIGLTSKRLRALADAERSLETIAGCYLVTGATLVVRRSLLDQALPIPSALPDKLIHDGWIALVAAALGGLGAVSAPTVLYRQHDRQQIGMKINKPAARHPVAFDAPREVYRSLADRLETIYQVLDGRLAQSSHSLLAMAALRRKIDHFWRRAEMPRRRVSRISPVFREIAQGGYHRYCSHPLAAALRDLAR